MISLLNFLGKLVEEVVADRLFQLCETNLKLHKDQMRAQKTQYTIDTMAIIVHKIY